MINQEQMDNNWTELMSIIDTHFEGEQKENILKLHNDFETEYKTAPASGRPNYHNCFKGGYLEHVLHVIKNSLMIKKQYEANGVKLIHSDADVVYGAYQLSSGMYTIIDGNPSSYSDFYSFTINSTYNGIVSGCYYLYYKDNSSFTSCYPLTSGTKLYGTPSSYRIISEDDKDKIAIQKQKAMTKLMDLSSKKLTEQDINAHKRYQQLLQIHNSIDQKPLKRYLQSFRSN